MQLQALSLPPAELMLMAQDILQPCHHVARRAATQGDVPPRVVAHWRDLAAGALYDLQHSAKLLRLTHAANDGCHQPALA